MTHIIIQGDPVTQRDIERFIQDHKMRFYELEKNKIRLNDHLTAEEKNRKLCMLFYREQQLKARNRD